MQKQLCVSVSVRAHITREHTHGSQRTTSHVVSLELATFFETRFLFGLKVPRTLGWLMREPQDLPISSFSALGLQTYACLAFYVSSGTGLRSLCLDRKHFAKWITHTSRPNCNSFQIFSCLVWVNGCEFLDMEGWVCKNQTEMLQTKNGNRQKKKL